MSARVKSPWVTFVGGVLYAMHRTADDHDHRLYLRCDGTTLAVYASDRHRMALASKQCEGCTPFERVCPGAQVPALLVDGPAHLTDADNRAWKYCHADLFDRETVTTAAIGRELALEFAELAVKHHYPVMALDALPDGNASLHALPEGRLSSPATPDTVIGCGVDPRYLRDALKAMRGEAVTLRWHGRYHLVTVETAGHRAAIMPRRLCGHGETHGRYWSGTATATCQCRDCSAGRKLGWS